MVTVNGKAILTKRPPVEINVQARLCNGAQYHGVGDLVTYQSVVWTVKGWYFGPTRNGQRELYYILTEATATIHQPEDA
jgi:hypothetical protein